MLMETQYIQLHVNRRFIALISSGLEERSFGLILSCEDYIAGINALNMMYMLFGDYSMYPKPK